jgi:hypothetical protein
MPLTVACGVGYYCNLCWVQLYVTKSTMWPQNEFKIIIIIITTTIIIIITITITMNNKITR